MENKRVGEDYRTAFGIRCNITPLKNDFYKQSRDMTSQKMVTEVFYDLEAIVWTATKIMLKDRVS